MLCGLALCHMVSHQVTRRGVIWCGAVCCGVMWCGVLWCDVVIMVCITVAITDAILPITATLIVCIIAIFGFNHIWGPFEGY